MEQNSRRAEILEYVKENGRVSVKQLAKHFYVSEMTIRRDLSQMEKDGYLRRYNGGAAYLTKDSTLPFESRRRFHEKYKDKLRSPVMRFLHDGQTVFLDSSSTCAYILPLLAEFSDMTLVTNSVYCALCAGQYHIACILAGGEYYERDMCTVGSEAQDFLRRINPSIAFFSTQGISDDGIISDSDAAQTAIRRVVLQNSARNIFLFDDEKMHKLYRYTVCRADEVDEIIRI